MGGRQRHCLPAVRRRQLHHGSGPPCRRRPHAVVSHVEVLWHSSELASSEHCSISLAADGAVLLGTAVLPIGDQPGQIQWTARTDDAGRTRSAQAAITTPDGTRRLALTADDEQRWRLDDEPADHLTGAIDVDLGWTPATNTLPIRRLGLAVGVSTTIT